MYQSLLQKEFVYLQPTLDLHLKNREFPIYTQYRVFQPTYHTSLGLPWCPSAVNIT